MEVINREKAEIFAIVNLIAAPKRASVIRERSLTKTRRAEFWLEMCCHK
jgi:hypothetical protein